MFSSFLHPQEYRDNYLTVTNHSNPEIMSVIRGRLSNKALEVLASTAVGHFLEIPGTQYSGAIVHFLLSREIVQQEDGDPFCMNFGIGGHIMTFGMNEFALATGLSFKMTTAIVEDVDPLPKCIADSPIVNTHFPGEKNVDVGEALTRLKTGDLTTCTDEENAKLALLIIVHVLLMGRQHGDRLDARYCHLVDDLDAFNKFPWGIVSHKRTIRHSRAALSAALSVKDVRITKKTKDVNNCKVREQGSKPKDVKGFPKYRVYGLTYALQVSIKSCSWGIYPSCRLYYCVRFVVEQLHI